MDLMPRARRHVASAGIIAATAVLTLTGCGGSQPHAAPGGPPTVQVATPAERAQADHAEREWLQRNHFTAATATVGAMRLHYVVGGPESAPMVVLLHGWPETWWEYRTVAPQLASHYRVLIPDLVGIDGSSQPAQEAAYTKKAMATDLHALVQQLHGTRPILVGHDVGTFVAYAYAAQYPTQTQSLLLTAVSVPDPEYLKLTALPVMPSTFRWWFALHNEPGVAERLVGTNLRWYLNNFYDHHDPDSNPRTGAIDATARAVYLAAYSRPGALHASFEWYRTLLTDVQDNESLMKTKLSMPVTMMVDPVDQKGVQKQAPKLSDHTTVDVVPDTGHWLPEQVPARVVERIRQLDAAA